MACHKLPGRRTSCSTTNLIFFHNHFFRKMFRHAKDSKYKLEVSNGMFAKEGFEVNSNYVETLKQNYEAEIRKFNLKNGGADGVAKM